MLQGWIIEGLVRRDATGLYVVHEFMEPMAMALERLGDATVLLMRPETPEPLAEVLTPALSPFAESHRVCPRCGQIGCTSWCGMLSRPGTALLADPPAQDPALGLIGATPYAWEQL